MKKIKICFVASSGGHLSELLKLKAISDKYESFLVTEKVNNLKSTLGKRTYFVKEINRHEHFFILKFIFLSIRQAFIFVKERPNVIISTGALCSYPMIRIGKIFKSKIIFIESFARINDLSLTGKKVHKYADLFLVQWPELHEKYENTIYVGNLFGGD